MSTVTVRKAKPDDLKRVQDLNHELFLSDQKHLNDLNTKWPYEKAGEDYFSRRIAGENGACFVAELEGEIVGYVAGGWSGLPVEAYEGKRAELENIYGQYWRHSALQENGFEPYSTVLWHKLG